MFGGIALSHEKLETTENRKNTSIEVINELQKGKKATEDEGIMHDVVAPNIPSTVKPSISLPSIMLHMLKLYNLNLKAKLY